MRSQQLAKAHLNFWAVDFYEATFVKSRSEKITHTCLYTENRLRSSGTQIYDSVCKSSTVRDLVLSHAFILMGVVVNAEFGFLNGEGHYDMLAGRRFVGIREIYPVLFVLQ